MPISCPAHSQMTKNTQKKFIPISHTHVYFIHKLSTDDKEFGIRIPTEAGLLNKSSCLAQALGVTKSIILADIILSTQCYASL
jgi:hypothetical protein